MRLPIQPNSVWEAWSTTNSVVLDCSTLLQDRALLFRKAVLRLKHLLDDDCLIVNTNRLTFQGNASHPGVA